MKEIILKPIGGLANRIRAIDSAISLSRKLDRKLIVIWVRDKDLNCSFNKLFKIPVEFKIVESKFNNFFFPTFDPIGEQNFLLKLSKGLLWRITKMTNRIKSFIFYEQLFDAYKKNTKKPTQSFEGVEQKFYDYVIQLVNDFSDSKTIYIASCWRLCKNELWYKYLIPIDNLSKKIEELMPGDNYYNYGFHIRRTDHKEAIEHSPLDKFKEMMHAYLNKDSKVAFYLSTDDKETEKELISIFKSKIIVQENKTNDRNTEKGIQDALVDLYCLSRTKKIFGSHGSSFSHVAADISKIQMETIM